MTSDVARRLDAAIKQDHARDNLHLTPAGCLAWAGVLRPYLAPFAVKGQS